MSTFNKNIIFLLLTLMTSLAGFNQAAAWEHHVLPSYFNQSSTAHYGGSKTPVISNNAMFTTAPSAAGLQMWKSTNDGISWSSQTISSGMTQSFVVNESLTLAWSETQTPVLYHYTPSSDSWSATPSVWPLANWNIMDVSASASGVFSVLVTTPASGKLVEGALYMIQHNGFDWSQPQLISQADALVGDAAWLNHASGLQSIVWSQRSQRDWAVALRNSTDGQTWGHELSLVQHIKAPAAQEAGVQIAADSLNNNNIALAYTGWGNQVYSQIWSQAFDAASGLSNQAATAIADLGDMAVQPSLVVLSADVWAVAWQQSIGIDNEIFVAQHASDSSWSTAVNVSVDAMHFDRDPHISKGTSQSLTIAFTRRLVADEYEVYTLAEGNITDISLDLDGDGIANSQEQGFDWDHDGIDDALSARVATWQDADGRFALVVEGNGELRQVQAPAFADTGYDRPTTYQIDGSLFSFEIHQLATGESTQVHLITPNPLAEDTAWLKLNPSAQWSNSEQHNVYRDAAQTGLYIHLTDGGAGDEDGISNGIIVDPAALATPHKNAASSNVAASETANVEQLSQAKSCMTLSSPWQGIILGFLMIGMLIALPKSKKIQQAIQPRK
ncbi:MAG: hypothetical protein AUK35_10185 [Zetaproteobacteria bacterium CG2_30_46_52]|nr:MAG: hypothetical protein AUK35_10185 [Zetaproteobacteria bacterium CG2_30_46_52]